ncbi:growth/differentiation factor 10-like [Sipha flava]|uniref:Growth/differentiation factor 10-like n=1 Tax=Sipha flava TaxID=143950 RepID=A0A8B8FTL9_9HEMI|nr:growth/differentiation factor 10-like [Sipha flava]
MRCTVAATMLIAVLAVTVPRDGACAPDVGDTLMDMLDIRTAENRTAADYRIPGYMYALYRDTGNRQLLQRYDLIRSVSPQTEPLGTHTLYVYDLSALKPTEIIEKAVLRLDSGTNRQSNKTVNVSLFSQNKHAVSNSYLGSANITDTVLDLARSLGPRSANGLKRLIVRVEGSARPSIGLVLYSMNTANAPVKGHEMAKLLFEANNKRRRRSVVDNEVDVKKNSFTDETKRKRKKKKGSRASKLQAVDAGDSIAFVDTDQCRMEKLVLNFADIGWEDWVIYPKGFETNYCAGGCLFPLGKGSRPTNHATVQSLARSFGRLWDVPEPSCVPDTLAPLTLLYMDRSNHVLLKSYPDMRVVTCSCK